MKTCLDNYSRTEIEEMCKTMTAPEIARKVGASPQHMYARLVRLGYDIKKAKGGLKIAAKHKNDLIRLSKTHTASQAAIALDIGVESVRRACKELGIEMKKFVPVPPNSVKSKSGFSKRAKPASSVVNAKPENPNKVKITVINRAKDLDDIRNLMSRPVYNPKEKTISTRY